MSASELYGLVGPDAINAVNEISEYLESYPVDKLQWLQKPPPPTTYIGADRDDVGQFRSVRFV